MKRSNTFFLLRALRSFFYESAALIRQFVLLALLLPFLTGCSSRESVQKVSLTTRLETKKSLERGHKKGQLRFAIAAMVSPEETFMSYKKILDYLSRKIGMEYVLVQKDTYGQVNEIFQEGSLDMAFVCSGAYVELSEKSDPEILAVPVVNGKPVYYSYIIVPASSQAREFFSLRGKTFAFVDPLSNTGRYYPMSLLAAENITDPNRFFKSTILTNSHSASINMVADGNVDGAAVDSLIYDFMAKRDPSIDSRVRIIKRSPPYAIPPFVAHRRMDGALKKRIREVLVSMNRDPEGSQILKQVNIEGFTMGDDRDYDSIRTLRKSIGGREEAK